MKQLIQNALIACLLLITGALFGQDVSLFQQFNGRYDFTFVGNTLNPVENTYQTAPPTIFTSSSATLSLNSGDVIEKAYLYWAGCGTGDFDVKLNNIDVTAQRTFSNTFQTQYNYFGAFADITSLVQTIGSGTYILSELDVTSFINLHYQNKFHRCDPKIWRNSRQIFPRSSQLIFLISF